MKTQDTFDQNCEDDVIIDIVFTAVPQVRNLSDNGIRKLADAIAKINEPTEEEDY